MPVYPFARVIMLLVLLASMSGCAWLRDNPQEARILVQYETLRYLDGDRQRAERLAEIIADARAFVTTGEAVAVDLVADLVRAEIRWHRLTHEDRFLVDEAIDRAVARLQDRVGVGPISVEARYEIDVFLGWIESAALRASPG